MYKKITGIGMGRLRTAKNRYIRDQFFALPEEKQTAVRQKAEKYFKMCKKWKAPFDNGFYKETILDIRDGTFQQEPK